MKITLKVETDNLHDIIDAYLSLSGLVMSKVKTVDLLENAELSAVYGELQIRLAEFEEQIDAGYEKRKGKYDE